MTKEEIINNYYSTKEVSKLLKVTEQTVLNRTKKIKLLPRLVKKKKYYSDEQIEKLKKYKSITDISKLKKYSSVKINIIDFFLTHYNNSAVEIANKMELTEKYVSDTITEYLNNNNTITVISKL